MTDLSLTSSLYIQATPAGAYYALSSLKEDHARKLLRNVLKNGFQGPLDQAKLEEWVGMEGEQVLQLLYRLERLEFLFGTTHPVPPPKASLEQTLPGLLGRLSDGGRALLADDNGLYLAAAGFHHETAEEIAALAGDILSMSDRHALLLHNHLNISSRAWAISDANGRGELSFFPLHIGEASFVLILGGNPRLTDDGFVTLAQVLSNRYG